MGIKHNKSQRGFALVLVLGVLLVAASIVATVISRQENEIVWNPVLNTQDQLNTVQQALVAYQRKNHKLPLPAARSDQGTPHVETTYELASRFGLPDDVDKQFQSGATSVITPSGVRYVSTPTGDLVAIGAIPTQDLGLPRRAAEDSEGKFLTYAVTFSATDPTQFDTATGAITTVDANGNVVAQGQTFLVLSHGSDAKGGWSVKSRRENAARACGGTIASRSVNGQSSAPIDQGNCDEADGEFVVNDLNLVAGSNYFDDQLLDGGIDEQAANQNQPCPPQVITWGPGNFCSGTTIQLFDSSTSVLPNSQTVESTTSVISDTADVECNEGSLTVTPGTCTLPASGDCSSQAVSWVVGSNTCTDTAPDAVEGTTYAADDSTDPTTGTQGYECNSGNWTVVGAGTCVSSCSAQAVVKWTVGLSTCEGSLPAAANGAGASATDSILPSTGSRSHICNNGTWNPTSFGTCALVAPLPCALPWGGTINDGDSVQAFAIGSASCGNSCPASTTRTCNNGVLSGSGDFQNCSNTLCASCPLPWGGVIAHGQSTLAYEANSCGFTGAKPTCNSETRVCNDGTLSGSYTNENDCTEHCSGVGASCNASNLNWNNPGCGGPGGARCVACNGSVGAAADGTTRSVSDTGAPTTGSRNFNCDNGTWVDQGGGSCVSAAPSGCSSDAQTWTIGGQTCNATVSAASSGQTRTATDSSGTTGSQDYQCNNGVWSTSGIGTCSAAAPNSCSTEIQIWSVGGRSCSGSAAAASDGVTRIVSDTAGSNQGERSYVCNNGTWDSVGVGTCATQAPTTCPLPWGGTINDGDSVQAFSVESVSCGNSCPASTTRTCNAGVLSGSGDFQSCSVESCNSCLPEQLNWTVSGNNCTGNTTFGPHGSTQTLNDTGGGDGTTGIRTYECNNGSWSGQGVGTCSAAATAPCNLPASLGGGTLAHGNSIQAFSTDSVSCGNSCPASTTRTCNNGVLSGSGNFLSCSVGACSGCTAPWGDPVPHNGSVVAYFDDCGGCSSQSRVCNNGVLSGSYTNQGCTSCPGEGGSIILDPCNPPPCNPAVSSCSFRCETASSFGVCNASCQND